MTDADPAIRILVVDDTTIVREMLAWMLQSEGYDVAQADSGMAALREVEEHPPSLMMLDLHMPGMDGFGVMESLRDESGEPRVPVIMFTADDDPDVIDKAKRLGARDFMVKGRMDLASLLAGVREHTNAAPS